MPPHPPRPPPPPPPPSPFRTRLRSALWLTLPFYLAATTAILLNDSFAEITWITGSSMSPTLSPHYDSTASSSSSDLVLFRKSRPTRALRRGDVVFFHAPHNPESVAVKRVVALGGDTVVLDRRRRPKDVENGRVNEGARRWDRYGGRVVVPAGHLWVEGDNWRKTMDCNDYGPISRSLVSGVAWRLVWPWRQFGTKPWEGYENQTRVVEGQQVVRKRGEEVQVAVWEPHG